MTKRMKISGLKSFPTIFILFFVTLTLKTQTISCNVSHQTIHASTIMDGMNYNYTYKDFSTGASQTASEEFNYMGDGEKYSVSSTLGDRIMNNATREIVDDLGNGFLNGSHECFLVPSNASVGLLINISVLLEGDQPFMVDTVTTLKVSGERYRCYRLESPSGSVAFYEQRTGLLINGTFVHSSMDFGPGYSIEMKNTTVTIPPAPGDDMETLIIAAIIGAGILAFSIILSHFRKKGGLSRLKGSTIPSSSKTRGGQKPAKPVPACKEAKPVPACKEAKPVPAREMEEI
ncbi:hypothetical protein GF325_01390 [Candidatus Bathyarchaeota archaeon]|nr:hypothetical protein [Candidatus Bathyarchaeota archaeon]